jgi:hypothetical protein
MSDGKEIFNITSEDGEIDIRRGALPDIYMYKGYQCSVRNLDSLIELVRRKGNSNVSVIFYDDTGVHVVMDSLEEDRPQDTVDLKFRQSEEYQEWAQIIGKQINQKTFVDFLRRRPDGQVEDNESLLAAAQKINFATTITGEASYEDSNNVTFVFKMGDVEGSARLPRILIISMPLIHGSDSIMDMEVEMEFVKPKADNEKPYFVLTMPKYDRYWREALEYEIEKLKEELPGFLILEGEPR